MTIVTTYHIELMMLPMLLALSILLGMRCTHNLMHRYHYHKLCDDDNNDNDNDNGDYDGDGDRDSDDDSTACGSCRKSTITTNRSTGGRVPVNDTRERATTESMVT
jgi:hypothetical protein